MIPPETTPPSRADSTPSLAYTRPSDSDKQSTVAARIAYCLRWLAVIPGAVLASILSMFPLHFALYYMLTQFVEPYPELPERLLTPGVIAGTFVWVGAKIAPARKLETAVVLFGLWMLWLGATLAIVLFHVKIAGLQFASNYGGLGPLAAFIGAVVGFLIVKNENTESGF